MDVIARYMVTHKAFEFDQMRFLYDNTTAGAPLRRYIIDCFAYSRLGADVAELTERGW